MKASAGTLAAVLLSTLCPHVHCLQQSLFPEVSNYIRMGFSSGMKRLRLGRTSQDPEDALLAQDDDANENVQSYIRGDTQPDGDVEVEAGHTDAVTEPEEALAPVEDAVTEPEEALAPVDEVLPEQDDGNNADVAVEPETQADEDLFPADNLTAFGSIWKPHLYSSKPHLALGIGFPKCGSHYTWEVLSRAEGTVTGHAKELTYFEFPAGSGESNCEALHLGGQGLNPAQQYIKACYGAEGEVPGRKLLEFSPGYAGLRDGKLDAMIQRLKGVERYLHLRMVALVRDPVERATSEINMFREYGTANGSDEDLSQALHSQLTEFSPVGYHIGAGEYADRLNVWMQHFSKDQLLVVNTAQLGDLTTWKRMFQHLGLGLPSDAWLEEVLNNVHNNGRKEKSTYMKLSEDVKQELDGYYAERNEQLWELLGVSPWW